MSGARFCKEHELDLGQFYYWSNKYSVKRAEATQNKKCPTGFATVVMADSPAIDEGLNFTLPNGCAIEGITQGNVSLVGAILAQL